MAGEVKRKGLHPGLLAFPIVGNLLDAASTDYGLGKGLVEANPIVRPLVGSMPLFYAVKATVGVVTAAGANKLAKDGHRTLAKVLAVVGGAVPLVAAVHNLSEVLTDEG